MPHTKTGWVPGPGDIAHRALTPEEVRDFRKWARLNYDPTDSETCIEEYWHPVVREECEEMDKKQQEVERRIRQGPPKGSAT